MTGQLLSLLQVFGSLSLLAVGGGNALIPDMQRVVVEQYHWLSAREFLDLFAITRATPGPGSTIVLLIGQKVAGLPGAFAGALAMFVPSSLLVYICSRVWHRSRQSKTIKMIERALGPIAIGLIFASAMVLIETTEHHVLPWVITSVATLVLTLTEINPLFILAAGAGCTVAVSLI
ncbi:MAG: chromate transporter [Acidocella sp.]|nr:chromate transporter [Acidocella sp.]